MEEDEKRDMIIRIKSSDPGEKVYKEFAEIGGVRRPSELLEKVQENTDINRSNFYNSLGHLNDRGIVERTEGEGRAVFYELTDEAREVYSDIYGEALEEIEDQDPKTREFEDSSTLEAEAQSLASDLSENHAIVDKESYSKFRSIIDEGEYDRAENFVEEYTGGNLDTPTAELMLDIIEDNMAIESIKDLI